jgi:hypothetical protein
MPGKVSGQIGSVNEEELFRKAEAGGRQFRFLVVFLEEFRIFPGKAGFRFGMGIAYLQGVRDQVADQGA